MSGTSTDYQIQISLKTLGGSLINLPAESKQAAADKLRAVRELAEDVVATEQILTGAGHAATLVVDHTPATQPAAVAPPPVTPPPPAPPSAEPGAPQCPHGARQWKTGVGRNGPWAAWFCPTPKGTPGQCDPQWDRSWGK